MVDAREHTAVPGPQIEVGHGVDLGHVTSCIDVVGADEKDEIAIDPHEFRIARMNDERAHHAHCHLHHLIGMWVVHEGAALLQHELVDKGLARFDLRLGQPADAIHAARQQHAVPMDRGVLGQSVGDEEADLIAFDRLDRRPRRLAVVAPQMRFHARRDLAHHRFGDQMEFLPVAVHAPWQRPAVQRHHRLVVGPAGRMQRWLHGGRGHDRCLGDRRGRDAPAHGPGAGKHRGRTQKTSARQHAHSPVLNQ
jgi:hypothetical protein